MIALLEELDERLAGRRYLFGAEVTEADVRLWPTLARFDTGYNPLAGVTERRLTEFGNLWAYARDLYRLPAFRETTDFASFGGLVRGPKPTFVNDGSWRIRVEPRLADWDAPPGRDPASPGERPPGTPRWPAARFLRHRAWALLARGSDPPGTPRWP